MTSDKKLLKKCINRLLDGKPLMLEDSEYRYFRKGEIVDVPEGEVEALEHGIFKNVITGWLKYVELDHVDWLYRNYTEEEKEHLFYSIGFSNVIEKEHSR